MGEGGVGGGGARQRRGLGGARQRAADRATATANDGVPAELRGFISAADWDNELKTFQRAQMLRQVTAQLEKEQAASKSQSSATAAEAAKTKAARAAKVRGKRAE